MSVYANFIVTPYAGVWIEIAIVKVRKKSDFVTPYAGVWIEMPRGLLRYPKSDKSLPTRECGLK